MHTYSHESLELNYKCDSKCLPSLKLPTAIHWMYVANVCERAVSLRHRLHLWNVSWHSNIYACYGLARKSTVDFFLLFLDTFSIGVLIKVNSFPHTTPSKSLICQKLFHRNFFEICFFGLCSFLFFFFYTFYTGLWLDLPFKRHLFSRRNLIHLFIFNTAHTAQCRN